MLLGADNLHMLCNNKGGYKTQTNESTRDHGYRVTNYYN